MRLNHINSQEQRTNPIDEMGGGVSGGNAPPIKFLYILGEKKGITIFIYKHPNKNTVT
jgi:hypothetical protein